MRSLTAAAALAAAVAVSALARHVVERRRRTRREVAAERLMAGCTQRDNAALHAQLAAFRRRMDAELARAAVVAEAERVVDVALAAHTARIDPYPEGGPTA